LPEKHDTSLDHISHFANLGRQSAGHSRSKVCKGVNDERMRRLQAKKAQVQQDKAGMYIMSPVSRGDVLALRH
jgi:hypothetical protein